MRKALRLLPIAGLLLCGIVLAAPSAENSDAVRPDSPLKESGFPDAGAFNPTDDGAAYRASGIAPAPAAMTYYPPALVIDAPPPRPYALVAAPTLPCAPGYCPQRVRVRVDRH